MAKRKPKHRGKNRNVLPKGSLSKISNKRLNKLAKQGKLKKSLPKRKFVNLLQRRTGAEEKAPGQQTYPAPNEERDIPLEEADYEYFAKDGRDFSFLQDLLEGDHSESNQTKRSRKRKQNEENDMEHCFEKMPRRIHGESEKQIKHLLPIKTRDRGIVPQTVEDDATQNDESESETEEVESEVPVEELPQLSTAELFLQRRQKLAELKKQIASLASCVIEDPEQNIKKLKELRLMLEDKDAGILMSICKLVMLSLMEVFKDIIPDYRIRIATEPEKEQAAKKETKKMRLFEETLLSNYRLFLEFLEHTIKGGEKPGTKTKKKKVPTATLR